MDKQTIAETCARAAHEVNNESIGDLLSPEWPRLTDAQRAGVIAGAKHALAGGTPRESHALWLETRKMEGWVFGKTKDFDAKTSPCMVPYDELPAVQQRKDALFVKIVLAVAEALDE